jgi:hypothetical protein
MISRDPVTVIQEELDTWETPFVELDAFGTADAGRIVATIDAFAREQLGAGVTGYLFYSASIGSTHGIELEDGRRVVIKVRPPAESNPYLPLDRGSLEKVVVAQRYLADAGYPCPTPLLGPVVLARGLATVESWLAPGEIRDGHDVRVRSLLAAGLHEHAAILEPLVASATTAHFDVPRDRLFPQPHSKLFRPCDADQDIGWVRDLARRARQIAEAVPSRPRLGHCDWRVEHVRFQGDRIVATYDWDSLALVPEIRMVGVDAHGHTADWSQDAVRRVPTYDGILGFIADYERARETPFTAAEHRGARAWAAYWIAYGAWISIQPGDRDWPDDSWPALLRACGELLLNHRQSSANTAASVSTVTTRTA